MYIEDGRIVVKEKTDFTIKEIAESICPTILDNIMNALGDELLKASDNIQNAWENFDGADNATMCLAVLEELIEMIEDNTERWFD
jgi:hypothetical protein